MLATFTGLTAGEVLQVGKTHSAVFWHYQLKTVPEITIQQVRQSAPLSVPGERRPTSEISVGQAHHTYSSHRRTRISYTNWQKKSLTNDLWGPFRADWEKYFGGFIHGGALMAGGQDGVL